MKNIRYITSIALASILESLQLEEISIMLTIELINKYMSRIKLSFQLI